MMVLKITGFQCYPCYMPFVKDESTRKHGCCWNDKTLSIVIWAVTKDSASNLKIDGSLNESITTTAKIEMDWAENQREGNSSAARNEEVFIFWRWAETDFRVPYGDYRTRHGNQ